MLTFSAASRWGSLARGCGRGMPPLGGAVSSRLPEGLGSGGPRIGPLSALTDTGAGGGGTGALRDILHTCQGGQ